jgi:polyphosphate kinase
MERNLDRRVEVLWPVRDSALARYLRDTVLDAYLRDTRRAMLLQSNGEYEPARPATGERPVDAQRLLMAQLPPPAGDTEDSLSYGAAGSNGRIEDWRLNPDDPASDLS